MEIRSILFCAIFTWTVTSCDSFGQYRADHQSYNKEEKRMRNDTDFKDDVLSRERRTLLFPGSPFAILIYGIGMPLRVGEESVIIGAFAKSMYALPDNSTYFTDPGVNYRRSSKSRWSIYKVLESASIVLGYGGKECLLRTICEAANVPFNPNHGLFEELIHSFLTPSSTSEEPDDYKDRDYLAAERLGRQKGDHCSALYPECKASILDIFSWVAY